jgi:hypothetical protein
MKLLLVKNNNGQEYDNYQEGVDCIFLVPSIFDCDLDKKRFYDTWLKLRFSHRVKFRRNGRLHGNYFGVAEQCYIEWCKERFKEMDFVESYN